MATSIDPSNLFASIDMGTKSFKLLIIHFDPSSAKLTTVHHQSSAVVLGRNDPSPPQSPPSISPASTSRAIKELKEFQTVLRSYGVFRTRVVGTSAIREASNQGEFLKEVSENLGIDFNVDVISGIEEARLIYMGVLQFLPIYDKKVLTLDIGGGSTEFVIGDHGNVVYAESLRLGHVKLSQKFREGDVEGMRKYVYEEIEVSGVVEKVKSLGFEVAIGSSGTVRAIEKAIWSSYGCDEVEMLRFGEKRDMWWFSRKELKVFVDRLCSGLDSEEGKVRRDKLFGKRSEFIVAGAVLLDVLLELLGVSEMRVSGYALGEGVVAEVVSEAFPECDLNANVRWKSIMRLAMRFNGKERMNNGAQCAAIAKEIFEGLKEYAQVSGVQSNIEICLQVKDLEYLEAASMLHNIGLHYGKEGYHKRSYNIIMEQGQIEGYTSEEIQFIAQLVKHHRKKFPRFDPSYLQSYSREKLGIFFSILRISVILLKEKLLKHDEIKFSHTSKGFILTLAEKDKQLYCDSNSKESIAKKIERKIAKEAELFETVFHQKIEVVA